MEVLHDLKLEREGLGQAELARARVDFATKAVAALEKRLADVAAFGGCRTCRDAEAPFGTGTEASAPR